MGIQEHPPKAKMREDINIYVISNVRLLGKAILIVKKVKEKRHSSKVPMCGLNSHLMKKTYPKSQGGFTK